MPKSTYMPYCGLLTKPTLVIAMGLLLGISQLSFAAAKAPKLKVTGGQTISYFCDNGNKLAARYYNLSDKSLSFVKLTLNGKIYTLPQVVSASGVRYTDERTVEWWSKGDKAMLDEDVTDDKSKLAECAESTVKKAEVAVKAPQKAKEAAVESVKKPETVAVKPHPETKAVAVKEARKADIKAKTVGKAKAETKPVAAEHAKPETKAAAKQVKAVEVVEQAKKAASTTHKK